MSKPYVVTLIMSSWKPCGNMIAAFLLSYLVFAFSVQADQRQQIKVGLYENPPKIFTDSSGDAAGFWPELLEQIATEENLVIQWVPGTWNDGLARLGKAEIDLMPDVAVTEKRNKLYRFADEPVLMSWSRLYVRSDNNDLQSFMDLEGKKIGALAGSVNLHGPDGLLEILAGFRIKVSIIEMDSYDEVFRALQDGRLDAAITNRNYGEMAEGKFPIRATSMVFQPIHLTAAFPKDAVGAASLAARIDARIKEYRVDSDSLYYELLEKYFETPIAEREVRIIPPWLLVALQVAGIICLALITGTVWSTYLVRRKTSELSNANETLRQSEGRFRTIYENTPVSCWLEDFSGVRKVLEEIRAKGIVDIHTFLGDNPDVVMKCAEAVRVIDVNKATLQLHRAESKQDLVENLITIFTPESYRTFQRELVCLWRGNLTGAEEGIVKTLDGELRYVNIFFNVVPGYEQSWEQVLVTCHDITERKVMEDELRNAKDFSENLIESMHDGLGIVDIERKIININSSFSRMTDFSRTELIGCKPPYPYWPPENYQDFELIGDHFKNNQFGTYELYFKRKGGERFPVLVSTSRVCDERGGTRFYFSTVKDMTEHKAMLEQLKQSQKMQAIGTLAGGIAHDFNNILHAINGFGDLVRDTVPQGSQIWEDATQIVTASQRGAKLVSQILDFSRKSDHHAHALRPELVVTEAVRMLESTLPSTIILSKRIDPECGKIMVDPTKMHQVIINLCTNSLHAVESQKGEILVSLYSVDVAADEIPKGCVSEPGKYVNLAVSDNGCGIDSEMIDRIFEPYFTTKGVGKGTGLGLSVVHGIVMESGGFVKVTSKPGHGTTVSVYFPEIADELHQELGLEEQSPPFSAVAEMAHIMVVDDEEALLELSRRQLEMFNFRVSTFRSSTEAFAALSANPDDYDVLVTDQTMPDLSGAELAKAALELAPHLPIILCSGFSEVIDDEGARVIGIKRYLQKPVTAEVLRGTIEQLLAERSSVVL